ncbi:MAG TPA: glycosyl transferase [Bacteroidetes bacterium]|nr:glycosyl transferase [Bacteroidota bacterium]
MIDFLTAAYLAFLKYFSYLTVGYFVAINVIYLILIGLSFYHIRRQLKEKNVYGLQGLFSSNLYSPISILAPAFNEESTIVASVKSLLQLRYPNYEVIVINDGSKDRTMDVLIDQFKLKRVKRYVPLILNHKPIKAIYKSTVYPDLIVVDKENGRKADALNAGINVCRNDLFCAIDADCVLEPDVLQNMLKTFIEDETTIAVGGIIRVANDCVIEGNEIKEIRFPKKFLPRIQVVEYLRAFLFGRVGWDYLDSLLIISGAFGIFDRNAVLKVGGYLHDTVGEDMELVVRLHKYHRERKIPYRVRFLPEPVCWTEVPEDVNVLARQRNRWQRGLADTLYRHRDMFFNPKYGRLGFFAVPFFFIFELLSPIIELLGWIVLILALLFGAVNLHFALIFLSAAVLLGMVLSISSILCEEFTYRRYPRIKDILLMSLYAFFENFGFRQVHMWWRLMGIKDFLKGNKEWGAMTRKGLGNQSALENLKTNIKEEVLSVTDETDYQIGDHSVDSESYIQSLDSNNTSFEVQLEEKSKSSIWLKFVAGIIFLAILGYLIWIQYF